MDKVIGNKEQIHIDGEYLVEKRIKDNSVIGLYLPSAGQFAVEDIGDDGNDE